MTLWDKFFASGRIEDYLLYKQQFTNGKEDADNGIADIEGTDTKRERQGRVQQIGDGAD